VITDLLAPESIADPHDTYRALREHRPITWLPEHHAWFVATYQGVHDGFRDTRLSSDRLTPLEQRVSVAQRALLADTFDLLRGWMVFHDPPAHERLRDPVRRAFTQRAIETLRPHVEATVRFHVDTIEERVRAGEVVDFVEALAFPLPAIVIAELLGVPPSDREEFKTWSSQLATIVFGASNRTDQAERAAAGTARFAEYFSELIARYETDPQDNLISSLILAGREADPRFEPSELVGACTLLLFGGHETTTNLLTNAVVSLATHPREREWLAAHPDEVGRAVEELHRFDGSSKLMVRVATEDHVRDDVEISAGELIFLGIASANRDPSVFERPDDLLLDRAGAHRHLGFGYGLHFCLGAPLARLEMQVALRDLLIRLPELGLAVAPTELVYGATILGRGLDRLPIALG
jgi:cytochrome P450